jgi:hypothetical protein
MAQGIDIEQRKRRPQKVSNKSGKKRLHARFVNNVFERIFSIDTSCFLHHPAVILRIEGGKRQNQIKPERPKIGNAQQDRPPGPREIVDLTRAQPSLLQVAHLAIDHVQLERLDLIFELVDRLDKFLRGLLRFKCRLARAPLLRVLEPRNSSILILDRAHSQGNNSRPG